MFRVLKGPIAGPATDPLPLGMKLLKLEVKCSRRMASVRILGYVEFWPRSVRIVEWRDLAKASTEVQKLIIESLLDMFGMLSVPERTQVLSGFGETNLDRTLKKSRFLKSVVERLPEVKVITALLIRCSSLIISEILMSRPMCNEYIDKRDSPQ